jgi:hypothetical protein
MKKISKFFWIYCSENHKKWAELIPHIESWLNNTVTGATGFTPAELMFGGRVPTFFKIFYQKCLRGDLCQKTYRKEWPKLTR